MVKYARTGHKKKYTTFDIVNTSLVVLITLLIIYPLYFCVIASFSNPTEVALGNVVFWAKGFNVDGWKNVLKESRVWIGYRNTIIYTILGTIYNLLFTIPLAYALSKQYLPFNKIINTYFFITMYVSGGLIPQFLLMKNLGMVNTPFVMFIGGGVYCYNMIVTKQYFSTTISGEIYEAAYIDGATEVQTFQKIAMPLAKPIIAVMTLYYGVGHWNNYYSALIYIYKEKLKPLQIVLRDILINSQNINIEQATTAEEMESMLNRAELALTMKYSLVLIASIPLLVAYPFIQKYFAKGVMIGAVKG